MDLFMVAVWGVILVGGLIVELITEQFVSIWFALASLASLILASMNAPRFAQWAVFTAVAAILIILTRPAVRKLRRRAVRTNVDLNIGKTAVVTEEIKNEISKGRATVDGVSWKAVSEDGAPIEEGAVVLIKEIDGAKLIVAKNA